MEGPCYYEKHELITRFSISIVGNIDRDTCNEKRNSKIKIIEDVEDNHFKNTLPGLTN